MKKNLSGRRARAFTLVELLVVIAIIAVLAGILLPVLASAKVAAMKTESLSNVKQIGTACILYTGDYDDGLPLYASGDAYRLDDATNTSDTWVWQVQPYLRSLRPMVDPIMGDPHGIFNGGAESTRVAQNLYPDYGLNYAFLAPLLRDGSGHCRRSATVYASGAAHPSSTIFFTTTYTPNEDGNYIPTGGYSNYGSFLVTAPGVLSLLPDGSSQCISQGMDWSKHPGGFNSGYPFTAEASQRYNGGSVVVMLDGHAKYLTADHQAAGTDWDTSRYMHTRVLSKDKYLWSFDDTFFGATVP